MAKIFDLDRFFKGKRGQAASRNDPNFSGSERRTRSKVQPINSARGVGARSWPVASSKASLNAGAAFLLVIGVLCGLYIGLSDKKSTAGQQKPEPLPPAQAAAQPAGQVTPIAKPSPIVPADKPGMQGSLVAKQPPNGAPTAPAFAAPRYTPVRFEATHKRVFGGCTGQLELTSARLHFSCPKQTDLDFPVDWIAKADKNGVELKTGQKYHFTIANRSKDQVEAIFFSWLNRVQPPPTERAAAF